MKMSGSSFEQIMQELLKQKQLLEDLETENQFLFRPKSFRQQSLNFLYKKQPRS